MTPITSNKIKDIIKSSKWKNSKGYDDIPQSILKISMPFILSPLVYICNKSLSLGIFPTRLTYSQITPIFKKGDETVITNYFFYWWGGTFGTVATTGLLYQPQVIGDGYCGEISGMNNCRGNRSTWKKPALAPLCPPQIPHD
jgi:hypothetical protein